MIARVARQRATAATTPTRTRAPTGSRSTTSSISPAVRSRRHALAAGTVRSSAPATARRGPSIRTPTRIQTVIGMQVDGPGLGISNQGGDDQLPQPLRVPRPRRVGSRRGDAVRARAPEPAGRGTGHRRSGCRASRAAPLLLTLSSGALLWAVKPAEEKGQGLIVRVWNVADSPASMTLAAPSYAMLDARSVTHIETDRGPMFHTELTLGDALAAHEMKTYRVVLASGAVVPPSTTAPSPTVSVFPNSGRGATRAPSPSGCRRPRA